MLTKTAVISTPAHADSGILTLLQTFGNPGLEMELDGKWYQVPNIPGCLIVNIGETLARMSNGRFKATIHRVIDINQDRYTTFWYGGSRDTTIQRMTIRRMLIERHFWLNCWLSDFIK